jgi:hypothetical protein
VACGCCSGRRRRGAPTRDFTLGCSSTHSAYNSRQARTIIAALDPDEFPVLTTHIHLIAGSVADTTFSASGHAT